MKQDLNIIILLLILSVSARAQILTDSNLPIVIIDTDGSAPIRGDERVLGSMKIICRGKGQRNYLTDQYNTAYLNYNGRIDIKIRGQSTSESPKKQYSFSTRQADNITNNNVSLLDMPPENDWILNGMAFDTAMIRDYLCFNLSRNIGEYASRTVYCEIIINGVYEGLYLLTEKIKADDNRVNIIKIGVNDIYLPELSGGYIIEAGDPSHGPIAWTMLTWAGQDVPYIIHLPQPEEINPSQHDYIYQQFHHLANTAAVGNSSISDGFPSIIDIPSFINYIIINELSFNADAYWNSTFFHKDRNGKLRAGPVWDFDRTFGNCLSSSRTNVFQFYNSAHDGSRFWVDLYNSNQFRCYLSKRWNELIGPGQPLSPDSLVKFIDQTVAFTSEAVARDFERWDKQGSHSAHITAIKDFLNMRIAWITTNLGSYSACSNVNVPPLVITKINYHPSPQASYPDNDDLEFIEISNNGEAAVTLTGIYFRGTGFVYCFPAGASLAPHSCVTLASNIAAFQSRWGFTPYGQFTRHLSNNNEHLVLIDAFGNVIDDVHYLDTIPWPDADGNGYYLKLSDINLDNSLASNWTASNDVKTSSEDIVYDHDLRIYPNPVADFLKIEAGSEIRSVALYDILGNLLSFINVSCENCELDMRNYASGTYLIIITTAERIYAEKIVKE